MGKNIKNSGKKKLAPTATKIKRNKPKSAAFKARQAAANKKRKDAKPKKAKATAATPETAMTAPVSVQA